jgi:hypothetical protein
VLLCNDEKSRKLFRVDFLKRLHSFHLPGSPPNVCTRARTNWLRSRSALRHWIPEATKSE